MFFVCPTRNSYIGLSLPLILWPASLAHLHTGAGLKAAALRESSAAAMAGMRLLSHDLSWRAVPRPVLNRCNEPEHQESCQGRWDTLGHAMAPMTPRQLFPGVEQKSAETADIHPTLSSPRVYPYSDPRAVSECSSPAPRVQSPVVPSQMPNFVDTLILRHTNASRPGWHASTSISPEQCHRYPLGSSRAQLTTRSGRAASVPFTPPPRQHGAVGHRPPIVHNFRVGEGGSSWQADGQPTYTRQDRPPPNYANRAPQQTVLVSPRSRVEAADSGGISGNLSEPGKTKRGMTQQQLKQLYEEHQQTKEDAGEVMDMSAHVDESRSRLTGNMARRTEATHTSEPDRVNETLPRVVATSRAPPCSGGGYQASGHYSRIFQPRSSDVLPSSEQGEFYVNRHEILAPYLKNLPPEASSSCLPPALVSEGPATCSPSSSTSGRLASAPMLNSWPVKMPTTPKVLSVTPFVSSQLQEHSVPPLCGDQWQSYAAASNKSGTSHDEVFPESATRPRSLSRDASAGSKEGMLSRCETCDRLPDTSTLLSLSWLVALSQACDIMPC